MQRDIRGTALFQEIDALHRRLCQPGTGQISDAAEVHVAPDGRHAVFAATILDELEGTPPTRICQLDLASGHTDILTSGPHTDRLPKFSSDGRYIAFLSDRRSPGDYQLHLYDHGSGTTHVTARVDGWVEYLHWSPDGARILLGVAAHGADLAGGQGAVRSKRVPDLEPSWMPQIDRGDDKHRSRHAWVYTLATEQLRRVTRPEINVWEAVWCGESALAAVVSDAPGEGAWYGARVQRIDVETDESREVYQSPVQMGSPAASPSGEHLAIVEALCSDRGFVAGDVLLIQARSGHIERLSTAGVDVTYLEWRSARHLLLAGHRGFESVVGLYDAAYNTFKEVWSSQEVSSGGFYMSVSGFGEPGDCVILGESFTRAPEIATICQGKYEAIKSFDLGYATDATAVDVVERVTWRAPDDEEMQGWLLRPKGRGELPLVIAVHGGPVWQWHPTWLGRGRSLVFLVLIKHGYAVFLPNPRGSTGRGQEFAGQVLGDMGGGDTHDYLSGLDHLVERGIADPTRLGITGISYGGFMTSWLITQDSRFAAAVPIAPVTNYVTEHLISNIPHFVSLFLADTYTNLGGKYFDRSPVVHSHKVKTPTLNICGALDRCTPPEEAVQFHNALLENGVKSVLVTYPEEGHGIRKWPASIDYVARVVSWFEEHMPAIPIGK